MKALEQDSKKPGLSDAARETQITKHQKALVECEDANKNTPLSEAGAGGQSETIRLLIEKGADINTKGQYHRTPLWRAAFAGHLQAVQVNRMELATYCMSYTSRNNFQEGT